MIEKKFYNIVVVGAQKEGAAKGELKFMRETTTPAGKAFDTLRADKRKAFFWCELTESFQDTVTLPNGKVVRTSNPQMKPYTFNVFERSHPNLFKDILREIKGKFYEPVEGDKEGVRIQLTEYAALGAIVSFSLPHPVYRMNRNRTTHKLEYFLVPRLKSDGSSTSEKNIMEDGKTFIFGSDCDTEDVFIKRAQKAIIDNFPAVKPEGVVKDDASAVANAETEEAEPEETETTTDSSDAGV